MPTCDNQFIIQIHFNGAPGGDGKFNVCKQGEKYYCEQIEWRQKYSGGPGNVIVWREKRKWKSDKTYFSYIHEIGEAIDIYEKGV